MALPTATGLAASIPVLHSTAVAVGAGWLPEGDDGIIATRAWDVLTAHTPLVGQYSEAGLVVHGQAMHSPGPLLYWLLALPARLGGVSSLAVTMCVVNVMAIVGCVWLARRRGGLPLMFALAAGIALMCQSLPTEGLHDIWNPAAGLLPFLLLVLCGWSVACGDAWLLPAVALLTSFVVQTHLMYVLPTAVVVAVALGGLLAGRILAPRLTDVDATITMRRRPRTWPWLAGAAAVTAACWAAPLLQQITGRHGNLAMLAHTAGHHGPALGSTIGWHTVVRAVGVRPWWLYVPPSEWHHKYDVLARPDAIATQSTLAILAALLLVVAIAIAVRHRALAAAALIGLGLCAAIGVQASLNPSGSLLAQTIGYTTWWGSELGLWVWLVLAWALWLLVGVLVRPALRAWRARPPAGLRIAAVAASSLACAAGVALVGRAVAATGRPDSHVYDYMPTRALAAGIERLVPRGVAVDYRFGPLDPATQPMEPAVRYLLVRHGDRPMARGSYKRLGDYYEPHGRPRWIVDLRDGVRPPQAGMWSAARARFDGPWGPEVVSAWVQLR